MVKDSAYHRHQRSSKVGKHVRDHKLDEGEAHELMDGVIVSAQQRTHQDLAEAQMEGGNTFYGGGDLPSIPSGQRTPRNLAEAQMEGGYALYSDGSHSNAAGSSEQRWASPGPPSSAPLHALRLARFPKDRRPAEVVERQIIDVTADKLPGEDKPNNMPDFTQDWGRNESWRKKAYYLFVEPRDIPEHPILHGWYVMFILFDPRYIYNTHIVMAGRGRHVHEDIFIAKTQREPHRKGSATYIDMPEEFLTGRTHDGWLVYDTYLGDTKTSMLGTLCGM